MAEGDPGSCDDSHDCRCICGSLIARMVADGVELKCRRCKRTTIVPIVSVAATPGARFPAPAVGTRSGARTAGPTPMIRS